MGLSAGDRLGPYEIVAPLGAGGMGEVYRARDARLGRDVALKVLPPTFAKDPERMARFEREAQVLASLNHPNIAALYGLEESDGVRALVLELVEGPTLAERVAAGAIPVAEALAIAKQIIEALEEAHEKGVVHRDLKPANIKVREDGTVKVLDFGLAKALLGDQVGADSSRAATLAADPTRTGAILGTPAYMSPEQARGRVVDQRTDVWAFGCVLYELLTGRQAFGSASAADSMVAILKDEPDWSALPAGTPVSLRRLLRRCLTKDPQRRWHDIVDARLDLFDTEEPASQPAHPPVAAPTQPRPASARWRWAAAVLLAVAAAFAVAWWRSSRAPATPAWTGETLGGSTVALGPRLSPDGQLLAFQALVDGVTQVAVMKPESGNWTVLTRERSRGFVWAICWSPDGTRIYFDRQRDVPRGVFSVPVLGGEERLVLDAAATPEVLPDGSLVVSRINPDRNLQLHRFWPETGRLEALPARIPGPSGQGVRVFPDGKEVVFVGWPLEASASSLAAHLYAMDLASGMTRRLAPGLLPPLRVPAIGRDGRSVLITQLAGNLERILAVPRDGSDSAQTLLTSSVQTGTLDVGLDGSLYLDQIDRGWELLRFSSSGGNPERLAVTLMKGGYEAALPLPDGRMLLPSFLAGRSRLLVVLPGRDPVPFLDTREETSAPAAVVGENEVAFLIGTVPNHRIAIASLADGRIVRRLDVAGSARIEGLVSSPDGKTLYYAASGAIWSVPSAGGEPRKIRAGDGVTVDPHRRDLIIRLGEKEGNRLVRLPISGGPEQPIPLRGGLQLAPIPLSPNAVGKDGRILAAVDSGDSWFWQAGLLDPRTGRLERILLNYQADFGVAGWTADGKIIALAAPLRSRLWRFRPVSGQ